MQQIIEPVDRALLESELTNSLYIRPTNNGQNKVFIINCDNAPNVLREIGRLRELAFRSAGGGTGKDCDLDEFDFGPGAYQQLLVWNPNDKEIVGGYRYVRCVDTRDAKGKFHLATSEIYEFSDKMKEFYFPKTIELGRSFVQPKYQPSSENRKGLFSLDNLWDGLGALVVIHPEIEYLYGKVTMYRHYNQEARDLILAFMHHYFPDTENLVIAQESIQPQSDTREFIESIRGLDYKQGHHALNQRVRALGENIPPLFNAYMNTSPSMKTFPTCINTHFGDVEETGILITIKDTYESKKERHINSYLNYLNSKKMQGHS